MIAFKVLRDDMTSLGLRAAKYSRIQYHLGQWATPRETITQVKEAGGLYVAPTLSAAKSLKKYFENKYGLTARIFSCEIGTILKQTSCRIKTDKVRILKEIH